MIKLLTFFIFLGIIVSIFSSCKKDELDTVGYISVKFSADTIQPINEIIYFNKFSHFKKVKIDSDSVYLINFAKSDPSNSNDWIWTTSVYIPTRVFKSNGSYKLGNCSDSCWIEFVKVLGITERITYKLLVLNSCSIKNNSGNFEIYNETENSINIKINELHVNDDWRKISAIISCDLKVNKTK